MDLFIITFEAVFILIGIGLLGFLILLRRLLPGDVLPVLTPLVIDIAIPCLVFSSIMKSFNPSNSPGWYLIPLWWGGFTAVAFCLTMILSYSVEKRFRGEFRVALLYHNAIFIPLGIITGIHGTDSSLLADLFLFTIFHPAFFFNTNHLFFKKTTDGAHFSFQWRMLLNPILLASILSLSLKLSGASLLVPEVLIRITSIVAATALPLVMLIIGGSIYLDLQNRESFRIRESVLFVMSKNLIFPVVFLGIIYLMRPSHNIAFLLIMAAAAPPITAVPIVTEKAGGNRGIANQMMLSSFLASMFSLPLVLWVFSLLFPQ
ncbi:MAG TPA: AEC family transporter [Spirochaetota bacterium]|nr:AEC family transporter [Spirochaetota bacterium]